MGLFDGVVGRGRPPGRFRGRTTGRHVRVDRARGAAAAARRSSSSSTRRRRGVRSPRCCTASRLGPGDAVGGVILNKVGSARHEELLREAPWPGRRAGPRRAARRRIAHAVPPPRAGPRRRTRRPAAGRRRLAGVVAAGVDLDAVLALAGPRARPARPPRCRSPRRRRPDSRARAGSPPASVAVAGGRGLHVRLRRAPRTARRGRRGGRPVRPAAGRGAAGGDGLAGHRRRLPRGARRGPVGQRAGCGRGSRRWPGGRPGRRRVRGPALPGPVARRRTRCAGSSTRGRAMTEADARLPGRGGRDGFGAGAGGERVRGHEFHRTAAVPAAGDQPAWRLGPRSFEGHVAGSVIASYSAHPLGRPPGSGGQVHRRLR